MSVILKEVKNPWVVRLLYLFALWWIVFSFAWFSRNSDYRLLYATVGLVSAVVVLFSAYFLSKGKIFAWWIATVFVGFNILVSVFDQIGWVDIIFILVCFALFILLLKSYPRAKTKQKRS